MADAGKTDEGEGTTAHVGRKRRDEPAAKRNHRHAFEAFMMGMIVMAVLGGVAVAVHDSGSNNAAAGSDARSISAVSPVPTTAVVAPVRTPTDAAEQLYFAWQRGDRVGATKVANSVAIAGIFASKTTAAAGLAFAGCSKPVAGTSTCRWTRHNARLTMTVSAPGQGVPQVQSAVLR